MTSSYSTLRPGYRFLILSVILLTLIWIIFNNSNFYYWKHPFEGSALKFIPYSGSSDCAGGDITCRLMASESDWNLNKLRRQVFVEEVIRQNLEDLDRMKILWGNFQPSFNCPFKMERIGRSGDGGKWICGFDKLETKDECVIFSFGISGDTSFEDEVLSRTKNCIIHMFDHTVSSAPAVVNRYPGRAFYHHQGIGSEDGNSVSTLKTIMTNLNVKCLDILKMDVEGAEWDSMRKVTQDFLEKLPFAQFALELHVPFGTSWLQNFSDWWVQLESAGLRQFSTEPNLVYPQTAQLREVAFLNTKMKPFKV